jgi:hypothetical protein
MKTPRNYSNLPTFHPTMMEITFIRSQARLGTPAQLAARRAAWLKAQHLPQRKPAFRFAVVSCSQCGKDFGPGDHGFSRCVDHKGR